MAAPSASELRAVALVGRELAADAVRHRTIARTLSATTQAADIEVHDVAARIYEGPSTAYAAEHPTTTEEADHGA